MMMFRISLSLAVFLLLLNGCDFFGTAPVTGKPQDLNHFGTSLKEAGTISYTLDERLEPESGNGPSIEVSRRKAEFKYLGDSIAGSDTLCRISMTISNRVSGKTESDQVFLVRFESTHIEYTPQTNNGGPKFFIMKTAAAGDTSFYESLITVLLWKSERSETRGKFTFFRKISGLDTIPFADHLEETWKVDETVSYSGRQAATGTFWYGQSGMIKCMQIWPGMERRDNAGASLGRFRIVRSCALLEF